MRWKSSWLAGAMFGVAALLPHAARAESERQRELRTGEAETQEPLTDEPLKAVLQNLFLQEDVFPQERLALQAGERISLYGENGRPALEASTVLEFGVYDSLTLQLRTPVSLLPKEQRGVANLELGALYSFWVSARENLRVSGSLNATLPSGSRAGENAIAHDLSAIGYLRLAPLHLQGVATLDVSYGKDVADGPRARPEGALAAVLKIAKYAAVLELAAQREFSELRYVAALGGFVYPGSFEIGAAARFDFTDGAPSYGGIVLVSYSVSFRRSEAGK